MDKVTPIEDAELERIQQDLRRMRLFKDAMTEYHRHLAEVRKEAFDAHIEAGFTEDQALQLVRDIKE